MNRGNIESHCNKELPGGIIATTIMGMGGNKGENSKRKKGM